MEVRDEESAAALRRSRLWWCALLIAALLLLEATAQPALAAAVACSKFGWPDFRTGIWLLRVDPVVRRGRACFCFYTAFGLWKIAFMSFATSIVFVWLMIIGNVNQQAMDIIEELAAGVVLTSFLGFGLSFVTTYVALAVTVRYGVKIWLGSALHRARAGRYWPPRHGTTNAAMFLFVLTVVTSVFCIFVSPIALIAAWCAGLLEFALMAALAVLGVLAIIFLGYVASRDVFASSPAECWPALAEEHVFESPDEADDFNQFPAR